MALPKVSTLLAYSLSFLLVFGVHEAGWIWLFLIFPGGYLWASVVLGILWTMAITAAWTYYVGEHARWTRSHTDWFIWIYGGVCLVTALICGIIAGQYLAEYRHVTVRRVLHDVDPATDPVTLKDENNHFPGMVYFKKGSHVEPALGTMDSFTDCSYGGSHGSTSCTTSYVCVAPIVGPEVVVGETDASPWTWFHSYLQEKTRTITHRIAENEKKKAALLAAGVSTTETALVRAHATHPSSGDTMSLQLHTPLGLRTRPAFAFRPEHPVSTWHQWSMHTFQDQGDQAITAAEAEELYTGDAADASADTDHSSLSGRSFRAEDPAADSSPLQHGRKLKAMTALEKHHNHRHELKPKHEHKHEHEPKHEHEHERKSGNVELLTLRGKQQHHHHQAPAPQPDGATPEAEGPGKGGLENPDKAEEEVEAKKVDEAAEGRSAQSEQGPKGGEDTIDDQGDHPALKKHAPTGAKDAKTIKAGFWAMAEGSCCFDFSCKDWDQVGAAALKLKDTGYGETVVTDAVLASTINSHDTVKTTGGNVPDGSTCTFPFSYWGSEYDSCTQTAAKQLWCIAENGDKKGWGNCVANAKIRVESLESALLMQYTTDPEGDLNWYFYVALKLFWIPALILGPIGVLGMFTVESR